MASFSKHLFLSCLLLMAACSTGGNQRGIADKRSDFKRFIPMEGNPAQYGLRLARPYFSRANRANILRAIEAGCLGGRKEGSSEFNPATQAGYYINCNPRNRQLLNGYVPLEAKRRPHSNH